MPVILIQAADHDTAGGGGMNKEIVAQIYTHMGDMLAVDMKENQVALFGISRAPDAGAIVKLFPGSARQVNPIYLAI